VILDKYYARQALLFACSMSSYMVCQISLSVYVYSYSTGVQHKWYLVKMIKLHLLDIEELLIAE
jgi:hypothetical protein